MGEESFCAGYDAVLRRWLVLAEELDYDKAIQLDAEALAEVGIGEAYENLLPQLRKYVKEPQIVEDHYDLAQDSYAVRVGGAEYVIYSGENPDLFDLWAHASVIFFKIVNDQLANSNVRFYALHGDNDLFRIFLTADEVADAKKSEPDPEQWPYFPNEQRPWYGRFHPEDKQAPWYQKTR